MKPSILLALTRGMDELAGALLDRADLEIMAYHDVVVPFMEVRGIEHRRFFEFLSDDHKVRASGEAEWRLDTIRNELSSAGMQAHWAGTKEGKSAWQDIPKTVERVLNRDLLPQMATMDTLRRVANETDLRLVIVQQDVSCDTRTLVQTAQRLGLPTLHTQHGYPYGATAALGLFDHGYADVTAVFGDEVKEMMVSLGYPADRVVVTGNFEWDQYCRPSHPGYREASCERLGLDPARPVITYALTYTHRFSAVSAAHPHYAERTTDAVLAALGELAQKHPDWQFVLRPHPNDADAPADLGKRCEALGLNRVTIDTATTAYCSVVMSDLLVCCQSNLGVEAILSGKPVVNVVIDAFGQPVFDEGMGRLFKEEDAVVSVKTVAEIGPAIEAGLLDPEAARLFREKRPRTIERLNYRNDGKAMARVCELVLDLVEGGTTLVMPVGRFGDLEASLAAAVPGTATRVLVVGRAARWVADAVEDILDADLSAAHDLPEQSPALYDTVVFADPIPHSAESDRLLTAAKELLTSQGVLVAAFLNGQATEAQDAFMKGKWVTPRAGFEAPSAMGQYSRPGVEIMLSRNEFVVEELVPLERKRLAAPPQDDAASVEDDRTCVYAWVARAVVRGTGPGVWGRRYDEARARGKAHNQRGESLFAEGRHADAIAAFARAVSEWHEDPVSHSNLATALFTVGKHDEAWKESVTALYYDPALASARENLRHIAEALGRVDEANRILTLFGSPSPGCP